MCEVDFSGQPRSCLTIRLEIKQIYKIYESTTWYGMSKFLIKILSKSISGGALLLIKQHEIPKFDLTS